MAHHYSLWGRVRVVVVVGIRQEVEVGSVYIHIILLFSSLSTIVVLHSLSQTHTKHRQTHRHRFEWLHIRTNENNIIFNTTSLHLNHLFSEDVLSLVPLSAVVAGGWGGDGGGGAWCCSHSDSFAFFSWTTRQCAPPSYRTGTSQAHQPHRLQQQLPRATTYWLFTTSTRMSGRRDCEW